MGISVQESKTIEAWLTKHASIIRTAGVFILRRLSERKRARDTVSNGDIAFDVRRHLKLRSDDMKEWRLAAIISTAHQQGAFRDLGVQSVRGVGWRYVDHERRAKLRVIEGGKKVAS